MLPLFRKFMRSVAEAADQSAELPSLQTLSLGPSDVLLAKVRGRASKTTMEFVRKQIEDNLARAGIVNRTVMVIDDTIDIAVIEKRAA